MSENTPSGSVPGLGSVLCGRYRLDQRVGRGGMADVYRGQDELLHRTVAIKLFRSDAGDDSDRLRIGAEMRTVAGLRHPGLVTLFDANAGGDESSGQAPFLVMEFIDGQTLRQRISRGPIEPAEVARLGAELAASLRYVHANGVVHRDIKPANILLDEPADASAPATAKLTDFGIAQLTDGTRLTMAGTTVGTANYLSPEQATGNPMGPASDVYSLGLVLIECLTGQLAYPGSGVDAALARLHRPPDIPSQFGPDWAQLLVAMTDSDPRARPDTAHVTRVLTALSGAPPPAQSDPEDTVASWAAMPTGSTSVMSAATAVIGPAGPTPGSTTVLPAQGAAPLPRRSRRGRRSRRSGYLLSAVVAAAVLVIVLVVALTSTSGGTGGPPPKPGYPSVPGQLGRHLDILEGTLS